MRETRIGKQQSGFTLIELVVVIVILGILAATAIPRFVNMSADARIATVNGMVGALRSAVAITQARYMATGINTSTEVFLQGQSGVGNGVTVAAGTGLPAATAAGIERALGSMDGFAVVHAAGVSTFTPTNGGNTCTAVYTAATGVVSTGALTNC